MEKLSTKPSISFLLLLQKHFLNNLLLMFAIKFLQVHFLQVRYFEKLLCKAKDIRTLVVSPFLIKIPLFILCEMARGK